MWRGDLTNNQFWIYGTKSTYLSNYLPICFIDSYISWEGRWSYCLHVFMLRNTYPINRLLFVCSFIYVIVHTKRFGKTGKWNWPGRKVEIMFVVQRTYELRAETKPMFNQTDYYWYITIIIIAVKFSLCGKFSVPRFFSLHFSVINKQQQKKIRTGAMFVIVLLEHFVHGILNPLTPNDHCNGRTAPLTSKRCILYIYSTNIGTEYFKRGVYSSFFLFKMQLAS